jgi:hypothetical protein
VGFDALGHHVRQSLVATDHAEPIGRAEREEHRTDLRRHLRVDDRKNLGPSAAAALTPDGGDHPPAGRQHPGHLTNRLARIGDVHQAEGAEGDIERRGGQRQIFGVHPLEAHAIEVARFSARRGPRDHRCREVDTDNRAAGADRLGCRERHEASAARHVEHALAGADGREREQPLLCRRERPLPRMLVVAAAYQP